MSSPVTVKDVAQSAEVSIATVSRVFNNRGNVTNEVRQRVLKAASELGYFGATGQNNATKSNRGLKECGFLLYDPNLEDGAAATNSFWLHILQGVEAEAGKSNIKVTYRAIGALRNTPQLLLNTIYEMRLSGILLVGPFEGETVRLVQTIGLPLVLIDNYVPNLGIDAVMCNNFEGARQAVEHLIEYGHRRIAFISGPTLANRRLGSRNYSVEQRSTGYLTALLEAGLPVNYELVETGNLTIASGYAAGKRLLERRLEFTALFCANDAMALGALRALSEAGLSVPKDVSLVGFDDIDLVEHLTPALTTVRVNIKALGASGVRRLNARVLNPDLPAELSSLEVNLIKRSSVAPPPA